MKETVLEMRRGKIRRKETPSGGPPLTIETGSLFSIVTRVWATHGGIGGVPWDEDGLAGHSLKNDKEQTVNVDRWVRERAREAGIPIKEIGDYGY